MSREEILILLGGLTALSPFAGIPSSWLELVLPVLGVAVIAIGFLYRREKSPRRRTEEATA